MSDIFETRFDTIVRPAVYERLKSTLSDGISPLFLAGLAGSGKTTVLHLLERDWIADKKLAFVFSLASVFQETDLLSLLRTRLTASGVTSEIAEPLVIGSSADLTIRSSIRIIQSLPSKPLLLFDGLDETLNSRLVLRFVRIASEETGALIVVARRDAPLESDNTRVFRKVFFTEAFSHDQIRELVQRTNQAVRIGEKDQALLFETAQGSPLLATILASNLDLFLKDGTFAKTSRQLTLRNALESLLQREIERAPAGHDRHSIMRLLVMIAICGPMTRSEIMASGVDDLEYVLSSSLLVNDKEAVSLVHFALTTPILQIAGVLPASDTKLRELKFGAEEAERDELRDHNFIQPPGYTDLVAGKRNIVIGDRGTGKSALFSQLVMHPETTFSGDKTLLMIPVKQPAEMLKKLEANGSELLTAEQFRAGWLSLAAFAIASNTKPLLLGKQRRIADHLCEVLGDDEDASDTFIKSILRRLWRSSIKIKLGPILIEPAATSSKGRHGGIVINLAAFIRDAAKSFRESHKNAVIAVDRVDEIHKYDRGLQEKAVQGLFLAEGDLAQIPGVRLLIFIRSDLFKIYDIQEKSKLISRSLNITWSRDELLKFLADRVLSNESLVGLRKFSKKLATGNEVALKAIFPSEIENTPTLEWLWKSLKNGNGHISPRQFILLLVLSVQAPAAQELVVDSFPIFPASPLRWGMDQLSELSFKELIDDFRVARTFLANCRAGKINSFTLEAVVNLFSEDDGPISLQVHQLERLGFLERVVVQRSNAQQSTEFRVPELFTRCWAIG